MNRLRAFWRRLWTPADYDESRRGFFRLAAGGIAAAALAPILPTNILDAAFAPGSLRYDYAEYTAPMVFSGFESAIPQGQIAEIGVLISALNLVCAKPSSGAHITGLSGAAWPELAAVTRKAFVPSLFVQIYKSNPMLAMLMDNQRESVQ